MLKNWDAYIDLVAEAYRAAPMFESRAVGGYLVMMPFLAKIDKQIKTSVDVKEVPYHYYRGAKGMRRKVKRTKKFLVSTADSDHPIFNNAFKDKILSDPLLFDQYMDDMNAGISGFEKKYSREERAALFERLIPLDFAQANIYFRTVHDFQGHIQGGFAFSKQGEFSSYNLHAKMVPKVCVPALFTEVIGQISCFYASGKKNCEQKAVLLNGFDYYKLGEVEGYDIVDKELKAIGDNE